MTAHHRRLPTPGQIQAWVDAIPPDPYFEQFADSPGLLLLRAKAPRCEFRGMHIALSDRRRGELLDQIEGLLHHDIAALHYRCSNPAGRSWFDLYTSGLKFGNWNEMMLSLDESATDKDVWLRFERSWVAHFRMGKAVAAKMKEVLAGQLDGGVRFSVPLRRVEKPNSEPHNLWFWHWIEREASPVYAWIMDRSRTRSNTPRRPCR